MDYNELTHMTVVKLREEAAKFEDVRNVAGMKKDELITVLAEKHGLEKPVAKPKKAKKAGPALTKDQISAKIVELKSQRDKARAGKDHKQVSVLRRRIHGLKRRARKTA